MNTSPATRTPVRNRPANAYQAFAGSRPRHMLAFHFHTGEIMAFSYIHLTRVAYVSSELLVEFGNVGIIKIQGKGLPELAEKLFAHEISAIFDGGRTEQTEVIKLSLLQKTKDS